MLYKRIETLTIESERSVVSKTTKHPGAKVVKQHRFLSYYVLSRGCNVLIIHAQLVAMALFWRP